MPTKTFADFSEIEQEIKQNSPNVIYKYRNWVEATHKDVVTKNQLWFSHPFDLNDPKDVRPDYDYDINEIESEAFYRKLINNTPPQYLHLSQPEIEEIGMLQWQKIKSDPHNHFSLNRKEILSNRKRFDQYGIFSTSANSLDTLTWETYGDNHQGYCIGFNTVDLARNLNCTCGIVTYSDSPFPYRFLDDKPDLDVLLYKKKSWEYEEEFRFLTLGIDIYTSRLRTVNPDTIAEVVLGHKISKDNEMEILAIVKQRYGAELPVYKVECSSMGLLSKTRIQ